MQSILLFLIYLSIFWAYVRFAKYTGDLIIGLLIILPALYIMPKMDGVLTATLLKKVFTMWELFWLPNDKASFITTFIFLF